VVTWVPVSTSPQRFANTPRGYKAALTLQTGATTIKPRCRACFEASRFLICNDKKAAAPAPQAQEQPVSKRLPRQYWNFPVHQTKVSEPAARKKQPAATIDDSGLVFTGERIVPEADNCEPNFASRMYQEHIARYLFASQLTAGKSVIDIGCGVGYGSRRLAELGARSVRAFDLSEVAIKHATIHYAHPNVTFETGNAEEFSVDRQFDVAVCFELIEHVRHPDKVLANIKRALRPDGILVMSTPRALEEKRTHFHEHEFGLDEFVEAIGNHFSNVEIYVENNHFASLVTKNAPASLTRIECLKNQFAPAVADVFLAVATSSSEPLPALEPVLTLDDDAYVTMLERDVEILHKAESDLREAVDVKDQNILRLEQEYRELFARSEDLSTKLWQAEQVQGASASKDAEIERLIGEYDALFRRSEDLSTKLWESERRNSELAARRAEVERLTVENEALRSESASLLSRFQEIEMKFAELEQERENLSAQVEWLTVRSTDAEARRLDAYEFARVASQESHGLRRELDALRRDIQEAIDNPTRSEKEPGDQRHRVIVEAMERLFLGTEATHHLAEDPLVDRVRRLALDLHQLSREIEALKEFQQHAEDWHRQLLRIRKSASWRLTAPLRGLARPFRRS
jgi:SAM-dependent methyltransferase